MPASVSIGGPFHLTDDKGDAVTDGTYRGRWMLVFFGYTNCPDECPPTLQKMATVLKDLGPLAAHVAPLFITVDPTRDTPDRLARYIENFDPRIIGLTGSSDQITAVANSYRVYYSPEEHEKSGADEFFRRNSGIADQQGRAPTGKQTRPSPHQTALFA